MEMFEKQVLTNEDIENILKEYPDLMGLIT